MKNKDRLVVAAVHLKERKSGKIRRSDILGYRVVDVEDGRFKDVKASQVDSLAVRSYNPEINILHDISRYTLFYRGSVVGSEKLVLIENNSEYSIISSDGMIRRYGREKLAEFISSTKCRIANAKVRVHGSDIEIDWHSRLKRGMEIYTKDEIKSMRQNAFEKRYCAVGITARVARGRYKVTRGTFCDLHTGKVVSLQQMLKDAGMTGVRDAWLSQDGSGIDGLEHILYDIHQELIKWNGKATGISEKCYVIHEDTWHGGGIFTVLKIKESDSVEVIQKRTLEEIARSVKYRNGDDIDRASIVDNTLKIGMLTGYKEYSLDGVEFTRSEIAAKAEQEKIKSAVVGKRQDLHIDANSNVTEIWTMSGETVEIPEGVQCIESGSLKSKDSSPTPNYGTIKIPAGARIGGILARKGVIDSIWLNDKEQYKAIIPTLRKCAVNYIHVNEDIDGKEIAEFVKVKHGGVTQGWINVRGKVSERKIQEAYKSLTDSIIKDIDTGLPLVGTNIKIHDVERLEYLKALFCIDNLEDSSKIEGMRMDAIMKQCNLLVCGWDFTQTLVYEGIQNVRLIQQSLKTSVSCEEYEDRIKEAAAHAVSKYNRKVLKPLKKVGVAYTGVKGYICVYTQVDVYSTQLDGLFILFNTGNLVSKEEMGSSKRISYGKIKYGAAVVDEKFVKSIIRIK